MGGGVNVVQLVVGALGLIPLKLNHNLRTTEVGTPVEPFQRCAFLG